MRPRVPPIHERFHEHVRFQVVITLVGQHIPVLVRNFPYVCLGLASVLPLPNKLKCLYLRELLVNRSTGDTASQIAMRRNLPYYPRKSPFLILGPEGKHTRPCFELILLRLRKKARSAKFVSS